MSRRSVFVGLGGFYDTPQFERPTLPSIGQVRCYIGVAHGLKERGALSPERHREYARILHDTLREPNDKSLLNQCKGIILELNILLDKSPSPNRGRMRSSRRRRNLAYISRDSGWHDPYALRSSWC